MVRSIVFNEYYTFKNQNLYLREGVNLVFGTDATLGALSSLLRKCFCRVNQGPENIACKQSLELINIICRFGKKHGEEAENGQNPAPDLKRGKLLTVYYAGGEKIAFHRVKKQVAQGLRYGIQPAYAPQGSAHLPARPVVHLGSWRHICQSSLEENRFLAQLYQRLPAKFQATVSNIYANYTNHRLEFQCKKKIKLICTPIESEKSPQAGQPPEANKNAKKNVKKILPLNTNIFCLILGLVALKWYHKTALGSQDNECLLLVDFFDQSLTNGQLERFLHICHTYATVFNIQIVATCARLELFKCPFTCRYHALYLSQDKDLHVLMRTAEFKPKPGNSSASNGVHLKGKIPIFMEDKESRMFMEVILTYFASQNADFYKIKDVFHLVPSSMGFNNLQILFSDEYLIKTAMQSICILDGDCDAEIEKNILVLPGKKSPEGFIIDYVQNLYLSKSPFWDLLPLANKNYSVLFYEENILPELLAYQVDLCHRKENALPVSGIMTSTHKHVYSINKNFFTIALHYWVNDMANREYLDAFYYDLNKLYKKIAPFYDIDPGLWP